MKVNKVDQPDFLKLIIAKTSRNPEKDLNYLSPDKCFGCGMRIKSEKILTPIYKPESNRDAIRRNKF